MHQRSTAGSTWKESHARIEIDSYWTQGNDKSTFFIDAVINFSKHVLAISLAVRKQSNLYTNEIASTCFEICLKRCEKRQE